jgi:phosphoribosyl-ATP pyrophosphohydrolase/phosphoribosyl-AMP cyclohydrolase
MEPRFDVSPDGLLPAIVQHVHTRQVLMLGYMNADALAQTRRLGKVTFYSRSKQRLWTKGESSGHCLRFHKVLLDCDADTLLVYALPDGPVCHTGAPTCFHEDDGIQNFLHQLEALIRSRQENPDPHSYTSRLFEKGLNKIAQKVGEEAVELIIEAKDEADERFRDEAADLLYHLLVLLRARGIGLREIEATLYARNQRNHKKS